MLIPFKKVTRKKCLSLSLIITLEVLYSVLSFKSNKPARVDSQVETTAQCSSNGMQTTWPYAGMRMLT